MNMKKLIPILLLISTSLFAAPPYDVNVTFSPPSTGGTPDGYLFYIDDCATSGPVGAGLAVTSGQTFPALINADGTYEMCVRAFNAAGENPDPGQTATVIINDLPVPGPINSLGIQVTCPLSNCTINVVIN